MELGYSWFEKAVRALEKAVGAGVTVIDNQGLFHTPAGAIIFPKPRQSHRKFPVCDVGFSPRCVAFCRHEMNRVCISGGAQRRMAFLKTCWKGVVEIVVPLRWGDEHWGMCYLGPWRAAGFRWEEVGEMPPEYGTHYEALPLWSEGRFEELAPLLEAFGAGIVASLASLNAVASPSPPDRRGEIIDYFRRSSASRDVSLEGLARSLHLSCSRTSRLLRELCHGTFTSLLHEERVRRARVLLLSTDDTLAAIAEATGFADEYHFSKVFRKSTGLPPGGFRRMHRWKG